MSDAAIKGEERSMDEPKFKLGERVRKRSGSWWEGKVVGTYSTEQTPIGYAVQLEVPNGPVQIYPEAALAAILQEQGPRNQLVIDAYRAMDAIDAIRKWCEEQKYQNDTITVSRLRDMLPAPAAIKGESNDT